MVDVPVKKEVFPRTLPFGEFPGLVRVISTIEAMDMENKKKITGYSETTPSFPFTNETPLSVNEIMKNYIAPSLDGVVIDAEEPAGMKHEIDKILTTIEPYALNKNLNMVQAATDHLLHDLGARVLDVPVWRLLTDKPKRKKLKGLWSTSGDFLKSVSESRQYLEKGYGIKIKLFGDVDKDVDLTDKVLNMAKKYKDAFVCADANESYSPLRAQALFTRLFYKHGKELSKYGFFVEEPIKVGKYGYELLIHLINNSSIKIMFDESLTTEKHISDFFDLIKNRKINGNSALLNVKIEKVGGLKQAVELAEKASKYGIDLMVGGMFPSSYGKLVNCQYALAVENIVPSDGVHPSIDYVSTPLIHEISEVEKMNGGYRDLSVFYGRSGMGAKINSEVLLQNTIPDRTDARYQEKSIKAKIMELDKFKG